MQRVTTQPSTRSRSISLQRLLAPAPPAMIFTILVFIVPFLISQRIFRSDGDLGRHIRVGSTILERSGLFYEDLFSYTAEGQPFIPFEWLSEVAFAAVYQLWGLAGPLILTTFVVAITYTLVFRLLQRGGVDPLLALLVSSTALILGSIHWLARPHIFSFLGVILTMILVESRGRRALLSFFPLFVVWTNLHGGFLFGLIVIGVYLAGDLAEWWHDRRAVGWRERARFHSAALGVATLGTLVNPVGPKILAHVLGYLGNAYLVAIIQEYHSPDFHNPFMRLFLLIVLLLIGLLALYRRRPSYPRLLLFLVTLAFALHSMRNIPLFALTALPALALEWDNAWRELPSRWLARLQKTFAVGAREGSRAVWPALASLVIIFIVTRSDNDAIAKTFDPGHYPVAAVEEARAAGLTGNIFNYFIWGGYLLYAWPEQRVFIDGQVDFYGEELTRTYGQVVGLQHGWYEVLDSWDVSLVLVPQRAPLASALLLTREWTVWYCDPTAILLVRLTSSADGVRGREVCPL